MPSGFGAGGFSSLASFARLASNWVRDTGRVAVRYAYGELKDGYDMVLTSYTTRKLRDCAEAPSHCSSGEGLRVPAGLVALECVALMYFDALAQAQITVTNLDETVTGSTRRNAIVDATDPELTLSRPRAGRVAETVILGAAFGAAMPVPVGVFRPTPSASAHRGGLRDGFRGCYGEQSRTRTRSRGAHRHGEGEACRVHGQAPENGRSPSTAAGATELAPRTGRGNRRGTAASGDCVRTRTERGFVE